MKLRDQINKDTGYWNNFFEKRTAAIDLTIKQITEGYFNLDVIKTIKRAVVQDIIGKLGIMYSMGMEVSSMKDDYLIAVNLMNESWNESQKCQAGNPVRVYNLLNLSEYNEMIWMLSLGLLLHIPNHNFNKLVEIIDRLEIKDHLFEFIIRHKFPERKKLRSESYEKYFIVPKAYHSLRMASMESDLDQAKKLVAQFVRKEWYNNNKSCGWSGLHLRPFPIYSGYWCYEAAAVSCIINLDESLYRDWKYYPKDLADYFKSIQP